MQSIDVYRCKDHAINVGLFDLQLIFCFVFKSISENDFFKLQNGASENLAIISLFPFNFSFIFSLTREAELCQPLPT